ncbi:hypothetical protein V6N11_017079 [Hibiscus sabdariffa]|uniref:Barwin domain-containing protein n=1 Tax=Hibiscus sabdariffa TaxID=183260 RepID=A0ABR2TWX8_9ROSI
MQVTNPDTDYSVVVRIVDHCDSQRIDIEEMAFDLIDDYGSGKMKGYLIVNYEVVDCEPPPPPPPPPPSPPPPSPPPPPPPPPPPSPPPASPPPPPPAGPGETNVIAYWSDYNVEKSNWSYGAAACAGLDGGKPLEWCQRYGWSGYCGNVVGSELKDICGKCLKVTNTGTKDEVIVRIVDRCGSGALELDMDTAFRPIDSDGQGYAAGFLTVDYQVVQCEDADSPLRLYSQ